MKDEIELIELVNCAIDGVIAAGLPLVADSIAEALAFTLTRKPGPEYDAYMKIVVRLVENRIEMPERTN